MLTSFKRLSPLTFSLNWGKHAVGAATLIFFLLEFTGHNAMLFYRLSVLSHLVKICKNQPAWMWVTRVRGGSILASWLAMWRTWTQRNSIALSIWMDRCLTAQHVCIFKGFSYKTYLMFKRSGNVWPGFAGVIPWAVIASSGMLVLLVPSIHPN